MNQASPLTCASCLSVTVGTQSREGSAPCRSDGCFSYVVKLSPFQRFLKLVGRS